MKQQLEQLLKNIVEEMGIPDLIPKVIQTTDLKNGDYTTNVAMVLAKKLKKSPMEIAEEIVKHLKLETFNFKVEKPELTTGQSGQKISDSAKQKQVLQDIEKIEIAPPGFINFFLSSSALGSQLNKVLEEKKQFGTVKSSTSNQSSPRKRGTEIPGQAGNDKKETKKVMVEFAHPNTHKAFHIGHLRNISTGESLVRLFESQGNQVIRTNYQGDVGMHIAKCLYGILQSSEFSRKIADYSSSESANWRRSREDSKNKASSRLSSNNKLISEKVELLGKAYAQGSKAYEDESPDGGKAKEQIHDLNFLIYAAAARLAKERGLSEPSTDYLSFVKNKDRLDEVYELWKETRQWSLDYFDSIYKRLGSYFDRLYFESECLVGVDRAKEALDKGVLTESDGAIIFNGKPHGLDTRVFVNQMGLPTYEGKELALAKMEFSEFGKIDWLVHVVGPEQASFFKVTFKVEELLGIIDRLDRQQHLVYGWVRLKQGKMSSRSGNVVLGEWLLDEVKKAVLGILDKSVSKYEKKHQSSAFAKATADKSVVSRQTNETELNKDKIAETVAVAAVKYSFLKVGTNQEIAFDIEESVNLNGDSGTYLLYTYARCKSVIRKADTHVIPDLIGDLKLDSRLRGNDNFNNEEKAVLRLIYRFPEIINDAAANYAPNVLCKYLYDLAGAYNSFYNKHSILRNVISDKLQVTSSGEATFDLSPVTSHLSPVSNFRLALTSATAQILQNGLHLLGIKTLERM